MTMQGSSLERAHIHHPQVQPPSQQHSVQTCLGLRFYDLASYVGYVEPVAVSAMDYDVIPTGPKALNRSGVCDVLCYNNSLFDWKCAAPGKCEENGPMTRRWQMVREVYPVCSGQPG